MTRVLVDQVDPDWLRKARAVPSGVLPGLTAHGGTSHDQSSHGNWATGGGGVATSGRVKGVPPEAPVGYIESAQAEWKAGYAYLAENDMPAWWTGTDIYAADGLPVAKNQVGADYDHPNVLEKMDAWKATVPDEVSQGVWMIGRNLEQMRKGAIQQAISMNDIDLTAAEERWGRFDIEPGGNGAAQWQELPPVLYHATSALSEIADDGTLRTRAEIGGRNKAAGLGGGADDTISFTDDPAIAERIADALYEANWAVNNKNLAADLQERAGAWWPELEANARNVHGRSTVTPTTNEERFNLYRTYAFLREQKEGILDPLFFNVNPDRLAEINPDNIGVVAVEPAVTGAKGYQVSALGEWRTPTGRATRIIETRRTERPEGFALRRALVAHASHDQSSHGNWAHGGVPSAGTVKSAVRDLSEPDGGFTLDAANLKPMTTGWAVALKGQDRLILAADAFDADGQPSDALVDATLERVRAAAAIDVPEGTQRALGGWHNPADGKVEVNVTVVFPADARDAAEAFGQDQDQIAIANLDAIAAGDWDNAIVNVGGTGGDRSTDDEKFAMRRFRTVRVRRFRLAR